MKVFKMLEFQNLEPLMLPVPFRVVLKIAFKIAVFTIVLLKTDSFLKGHNL